MFNGPAYSHEYDYSRLKNQLDRVRELMLDGQWRTLDEIKERTGDPESSISAQLRHLRKEKFGGYQVNKRRRGDPEQGLFEYQVLKPDQEQMRLV